MILNRILRIFLFANLTLGFNVVWADTNTDIAAQARKATVWLTFDTTNSTSGAIESHSGSGFIVNKTGDILTAYHVVEPWIEQIKSEQGRHPIYARISSINSPTPIVVEYVTSDDKADVAILHLKFPQEYSWVKLCYVNDLPSGTSIIGFGFPLKREFTPFPGQIANNDAPGARWAANVDFDEGASGGPVFDMNGRVIGIVKGGFGDVSAIRYITQTMRARSILENIGIEDECMTRSAANSAAPPPVRTSAQRAALKVAAVPDTVSISAGGYFPVDYRFDESKGIATQVETEDFQFLSTTGEAIGPPTVGARILNGSFQVDGINTYHNNIFLPPSIAQAARSRGLQAVQLRHIFHCRDANNNIIDIPAVLLINVL